MKLLLCAASARAMAQSAGALGIDFTSIDFFGDVDTKEAGKSRSLRELGDSYSTENLYRRALELDFTHVIYGAGFENYPELVEGFEKKGEVLGNGSRTLRQVRDWRNFFSKLEKEGIRFPKTEIVRAGDVGMVSGKILKSKKTGGGHRIHTSGDAYEMDEEVLLQEVIRGTSISTCIVGDGRNCRFLGATEQLVSKDYLYMGNIAPLETKKEVQEISARIGEMFGLVGVNGIDFIISPDGPRVLEVNPRPTGAMEVLERAYGLNLIDVHINACRGNLEFQVRMNGLYHGKKIIYADASRSFKPHGRPTFIKDVPADWYTEEGSPVCTVIGSGKTIDECRWDLWEKEKRL